MRQLYLTNVEGQVAGALFHVVVSLNVHLRLLPSPATERATAFTIRAAGGKTGRLDVIATSATTPAASIPATAAIAATTATIAATTVAGLVGYRGAGAAIDNIAIDAGGFRLGENLRGITETAAAAGIGLQILDGGDAVGNHDALLGRQAGGQVVDQRFHPQVFVFRRQTDRQVVGANQTVVGQGQFAINYLLCPQNSRRTPDAGYKIQQQPLLYLLSHHLKNYPYAFLK